MKTARAVIGSGYGDEGKGLMTDYFCSLHEEPESTLVVRYNGGAQAGHTVVTPKGNRHVFSHIGSGAFTQAATYLSEDFVTNPVLFNQEITKLGGVPRVLIHPDAIVTTPIDMFVNQIREEDRRMLKHGSCGVGVYETLVRNGVYDSHGLTNASLQVSLVEMMRMSLTELHTFLRECREYARRRLGITGVKLSSEQNALLGLDVTNSFYADLQQMATRVTFSTTDTLEDFHNVVFEGAQGLLLSEAHGEWPHLTPSNPGCANPIKLCEQMGITKLDITYVTRAYTTRHGAGRLRMESKPSLLGLTKIEQETNQPNAHQGSFRYASWNPECAKAAINDYKDHYNTFGKVELDMSVAITCLDQIPADANIGNTLVQKIAWMYQTSHGFTSHGPTRGTVQPFEFNPCREIYLKEFDGRDVPPLRGVPA